MLLLISFIAIQAQTKYDFKILRMTAFTEKETDCYGICKVRRYNFYGDTTINNVEYFKIYSNNSVFADSINENIHFNVIGAIRETEDSLVYYYNFKTKREVLLYDFGWRSGKQILSTNSQGNEYAYAVIYDIDTIEQNGWKTPVINTISGGKCLLGIGDLNGFFAPIQNKPNCEQWNQQLWCAIDERVNCICPLYQAPNCTNCETYEQASAIYKATATFITAFLYQNTPNPFTNQTEIRYYLPENAENAVLYVFSLNGNMLLSKPLTQTGNGSIVISNSELSAGMYVYTLAIDGVEVDSKRMILTNE